MKITLKSTNETREGKKVFIASKNTPKMINAGWNSFVFTEDVEFEIEGSINLDVRSESKRLKRYKKELVFVDGPSKSNLYQIGVSVFDGKQSVILD